VPDDPDLLTIGDFARAVGLPASALRHYDECGLLVPARTDASTGYRYYTPELERRARLVAVMREVGVPIDTMQRVLDVTTDQARALLDGVVAEREQQASRSRAAASAVLAHLTADRHANVVRVRVGGPALGAALRQVRCAADVDATSALASVLLDVRDGELDVVATNRHWLAHRTLPAPGQPPAHARAVLRLQAVAALVDRLDDAGELEAVFSADGLVLDVDGERLPVATSELPFPSYRLVLDALDPSVSRVVVAREALAQALTGARRSVVELRSDVQLEVAGAPVPAVVRGKPLTVKFRSALLLRAVASCVGDRVVLAMSAADRPVVITSPDQTGYTALVMPTLEPA